MSPPARATVCRKMAGSGFETPKVSAPQMAENRALNLSRSSRSFDSHSSLLVQTAKRYPAPAKIIERVFEAVEGARNVGDMLGIVGDEVVGEPGDVGDACGAALQFQAALDQLACARADHVARGMQRDGRQALAVEDEIKRVDQVGRRIDERAIKIEYDGAGRGHPEIAIGPRPIMQVGCINGAAVGKSCGNSPARQPS